MSCCTALHLVHELGTQGYHAPRAVGRVVQGRGKVCEVVKEGEEGAIQPSTALRGREEGVGMLCECEPTLCGMCVNRLRQRGVHPPA